MPKFDWEDTREVYTFKREGDDRRWYALVVNNKVSSITPDRGNAISFLEVTNDTKRFYTTPPHNGVDGWKGGGAKRRRRSTKKSKRSKKRKTNRRR